MIKELKFIIYIHIDLISFYLRGPVCPCIQILQSGCSE